jgi:hypothetical protein
MDDEPASAEEDLDLLARQVYGDVIAVVMLITMALPSEEHLTAVLSDGRVAVAAGPGPDGTTVASAYVDLVCEPVFIASCNSTGEVTSVRCAPGPWVDAVRDYARELRGGFVPDAAWFAPTSSGVH